MKKSLKQQLPTIIAVTLVCLVTVCIALSRVHAGAAGLNVDTFSTLMFLIPCVGLFACSFFITFLASAINRQLYTTVVAICFVLGLASMVVTQMWTSDPQISALLLANSPEGTVIYPLTQMPITVIRDVAAFFVIPTIGCIAGAWVGSRVHPMERETGKSKKKKSRF